MDARLFILGPTGHKPAESAAHAGSTAGAWRVRAAMAMMAPLDGHWERWDSIISRRLSQRCFLFQGEVFFLFPVKLSDVVKWCSCFSEMFVLVNLYFFKKHACLFGVVSCIYEILKNFKDLCPLPSFHSFTGCFYSSLLDPRILYLFWVSLYSAYTNLPVFSGKSIKNDGTPEIQQNVSASSTDSVKKYNYDNNYNNNTNHHHHHDHNNNTSKHPHSQPIRLFLSIRWRMDFWSSKTSILTVIFGVAGFHNDSWRSRNIPRKIIKR